MGKKCLAIDIEKSRIKFMLVEYKKKTRLLKEFFIEELKEGEDAFARIKAVLSKKLWGKYKIKLLYYSDYENSRGIKIAKFPNNEIEGIVRREAKKNSGDLKDKKLIYKIVGESRVDDNQFYNIFYILFPMELYKNLSHLDLKISGVDFDIFSINNLFKEIMNPVENTMVLDLGYDKTKLYIFKKGVLEVFREIKIGGKDITESISHVLQISYEDAEKLKNKYGYVSAEYAEKLIKEGEKKAGELNLAYQFSTEKLLRKISFSSDYFKNQNRGEVVDKVYLCGGGSLLKKIDLLLKEELSNKNVVFFKGDGLFEQKKEENLSRYPNLLGSLIKKNPDLKLEISQKKKKEKSAKQIAVIYIILAIIPMFLSYSFYKTKDLNLKKEKRLLEEKYNENKAYVNKFNELKLLEESLDLKTLKIQAYLKKKENLVKFLGELGELMPKKIRINHLSYEGKFLRLKASAKSKEHPETAIINFYQILEKKYPDVTLKRIQKRKENTANFELNLQIGGVFK